MNTGFKAILSIHDDTKLIPCHGPIFALFIRRLKLHYFSQYMLNGINLIRGILTLLIIFFIFPYSHAEEVVFKHKHHNLSGHYLEATNGKPAKAVLLFVHGDGAMPYDAQGYYNIIWQPLREKGYAIFSWDKPNVGNSSGNWLMQSMRDRQSEVLSAVDFVQNKYHFTAKNTGLFGFSQAGWVIPALASKPSKIGFTIGVGFATNWIEQGRYHTKTKHKIASKNKQQVTLELDAYSKGISFLKKTPTYDEYLAFTKDTAMEKDRFDFILNNFTADAADDYSKIKVPSLFLWGANDLNVNAQQEFTWWQTQNNPFITTRLIPNASHAMLNSASFDSQSISFLQWIKLMWLEQDALAKDFLPTVVMWLEQTE